MKNLNKIYSKEHQQKSTVGHTYPTEWVIRTMLGSYPALKMDKSILKDATILDMGYGDCRNMPLLNNIGMKIHGVEISEEITEVARQKLNQLQIPAELKIGHNTHIPYPDSFFDVVLACSSFYYINQGETFAQNMQEYLRVLKPGGLLIANFPEYYKSFICKDGIDQGNGHIIVTNDVHGLRNGYTLKVYKSKEDIVEEFEHHFTDISIGYLYEEYYEYELSMFIMTAYKK